MNIAARLAALERDRRADAEALTDWFEKQVTRHWADLDPERGALRVGELFDADPTLETRITAAYRLLGYTAYCTPDGTIVVDTPEQHR